MSSIGWWLLQVEVEGVEQVDGRAGGMDGHVRRRLQQRLRVVEDDLHARVDEVVRDALRSAARDRQHSDDDLVLVDGALHLVVRAHAQVTDVLADLALVGVEDGDDLESVVGEHVGAGDRAAKVAGAEQGDVVLAGGPQDLADLRDQGVDVVADAALAELAEAGEVATDLRRVDVRVVGELLRRDRLLAHLSRLCQHLQVARKAGCDAKRKSLSTLRKSEHSVAMSVLVVHGAMLARQRSSSVASITSSSASSPSIATTGIRSR